MNDLRIVLIKPSKYDHDGFVQRFHRGLMPNATLSHIASLTPTVVNGFRTSIHYIDEYVRIDLAYLKNLKHSDDVVTLVAIVGVQSHQFHRAIDLAAFARTHGIEHVVIGGPHAMTCDTKELQGRGVSFSLAEGEVVWLDILRDATNGRLQEVYGAQNRWAVSIDDVDFKPPPVDEVRRHWVPMVGYYPVRGCPFACNFCSVIKIAGRQVRSPSVDSIISALKLIKSAGIEFVVFTSDNFNKFPLVSDVLTAMIDEKVGLRFWFQADTQIVRQGQLIELIGRAGGAEMFLGTESFDLTALKGIRKRHNKPDTYGEIIRMCRSAGIRAHFSNIFGFPEQTEEGVREHMSILKGLAPEFASFYILTPIPGTDQYADYRNRDLIFERNLDRFDAHTPTFRHEHMPPDCLQQLLFDAYKDFYKDAMKKHLDRIDSETRNYMVFCRWSATNRMHPMSSGIGVEKIDSAKDYTEMRKCIFDVDALLPLPENLKLSVTDQRINRSSNLSASPTLVKSN